MKHKKKITIICICVGVAIFLFVFCCIVLLTSHIQPINFVQQIILFGGSFLISIFISRCVYFTFDRYIQSKLRRYFYAYEDQIVVLMQITAYPEKMMRIESLWDLTTVIEQHCKYMLTMENIHLDEIQEVELSEVQARDLCMKINKRFHVNTSQHFSDIKMYKHELDMMLMVGAIDTLTELQKRISP